MTRAELGTVVARLIASSSLALLLLATGAQSAWAENPATASPPAAASVRAPPSAPKSALPAARPVPAATKAVAASAPAAQSTPARFAKVDARPRAPLAHRSHGEVQAPSLDAPVPRAVARTQLFAVKDEVARRAKLGEHPVVVFDIDDTLLTWPTPEHPQRTPIPGALAYVTSLKNAGATIVYMTGRSEPHRGEAEQNLRNHGFPIGNDELLLLNQDPDVPTIEYKTAATRALVKTMGTPVAAFDNEKVNLRMFRREMPDPRVRVVRIRTTSRYPDTGGDGPITVVDDFSPALPTGAVPETVTLRSAH
jgi:hypothetical protein